jgi:regulator of ribosome biosynthesis
LGRPLHCSHPRPLLALCQDASEKQQQAKLADRIISERADDVDLSAAIGKFEAAAREERRVKKAAAGASGGGGGRGSKGGKGSGSKGGKGGGKGGGGKGGGKKKGMGK